MQNREVGSMRSRVQILSLQQEPDGCRWARTAVRWGEVTHPTGSNLFSKIGLGARSVRIRMRRMDGLTLHDAMMLDGQHLFLTRIDLDESRMYQTIEAAEITPVTCTVTRRRVTKDNPYNRPRYGQDALYSFPACVTEKYIRLQAVSPQNVTETCYVLVTPKCVQLRAGELVTVGADKMRVQIGHTLDPYKNEYEVYREVDA